jgi:hypothetical protein
MEMRFFDEVDDGFHVARGHYAIVAQDRSGTIMRPDQAPAGRDRLLLPATPVPTVRVSNGLEMLVLPVGRDRAGCNGRSIALGDRTLVVFDRLAIVPLGSSPPGPDRRDNAVGRVAIVEVHGNGIGTGFIRQEEDGYELEGFGCGVDWIDTHTPGAFAIEAEMFDMAHGGIAAIFGYGTDAFNAALQSDGFPCDVKSLREQLAGRGDPEARSVLARLPPLDSVVARYAPVIP